MFPKSVCFGLTVATLSPEPYFGVKVFAIWIDGHLRLYGLGYLGFGFGV